MIVTHCQNLQGERRIYLGGKGSVECYLAPNTSGPGWTFHMDLAVTGNQLTVDEQREWALHTLRQLSSALNVAPDDLAAVPFDCIAALHESDPFANRRIAVPRRKAAEHCFMSTAPNLGTRPKPDFTARDFHHHRHRS